MTLKKISLLIISLIPNAYILKSMLYFLPDLTIILYLTLYLILFVFIVKNNGVLRNIFSSYDTFIFLWVMLTSFSLLYSPFQTAGIIKLMKFCFLGLGIIYSIRIFVEDKEDISRIFYYYTWTAFILEICVSINFILNGMPFGRFTFFDAHPIPLGLLGTVTALVVVTQLIYIKISSFNFLLVFTSSIWIILISSSKGPLLALIVGLFFLIPSLMKNVKNTLALFILGSISFYFISKTEQFEMLLFRVMYTLEDQSTLERLNLYDAATGTFVKSPFLGGGLGVFNNYYPHNIVAEVFAEGGIVVGSLLMFFILWIIFKYRLYLIKYKGDFYYITPFFIVLISMTVLMVSFTYVDLKFLYFGLGILLSYEKIKFLQPLQTRMNTSRSG